MTIHWCGTGLSAIPGLRRLIEAGHDVTVWNRTTDKAKQAVGDLTDNIHAFDIDALDPAFAPGTGTPVWGGLTSAQAAIMMRDLAGINIVGGDIVEVSPPFDTTGATAIAGAHVATEILCLLGWNMRQTKARA